MLATILSWVTGGGVSSITGAIRDMRKDALDAGNTERRIELESTIAVMENRRAVLVAEAKGNWNVFFRMFLAFPFAVFLWKVVIWDKVLGWGVTDDLSPDLWNLMMIVFGFFFVYETAALFKRR
jgi:hypothetical protein